MLNKLFKKTKYIRLPLKSETTKIKGAGIKPAVRQRIAQLTDGDSFIESFEGITSANPLSFPDYEKKKLEAGLKADAPEAVITGVCCIGGQPAGLAVMDSAYMMGSMGSGVGEKITRLIEKCTENSLPLVIVTASGGARMQEGIFSLMQMAKTSAALKRFSDSGGFYISLLTHPTTGGVTASFAMLGDVILAEPGALIGFAGPRVIEQTIRQKLPEGFQTSEFLLEHGMVDRIVSRDSQKEVIGKLLKWHGRSYE